MLFTEYEGRKRSQEYLSALTKATEGYCDMIQVGVADDFPIYKCVVNPEADTTLGFLAGIHGNEPGGPLGVLKFLEARPHVRRRLVILPLANPYGLAQNIRRNQDNKDLNRHFYDDPLPEHNKAIWDAFKDEPLEVIHTLHEDPLAQGFYVYYTDHQEVALQLRDLARSYFPINRNTESIRGDRAKDGLVPPPHKKTRCFEDRILEEKGVPYFTTETPGQSPLWRRAAFAAKAMRLIINSF